MSESFPRRYARTQRFTLGAPRNLRLGRDGARAAFLRSGAGDDPVNALWVLDIATGTETLVADPARLLAVDEADLPAAERARRERAREGASGIVSYDADDDLTGAVFALGGRLFRADLINHTTAELVAERGVYDPRLDPTGTWVAYVVGTSLRVTDGKSDRELISESGDTVSWGSAEFIAGEEMFRTRGHWWSPDGSRVLVERVDVADVAVWYVSSVTDPAAEPRPMRYPAAGTDNAAVSLAVIGLDGTRVDIDWAQDEFEYLAEVMWRSDTEVTLTVQTRDQRTLAVLGADATTGAVTELARDHDDRWVELVDGVPKWAGDALVTVADRDGARRLLVDGVPVTPVDIQVQRVVHVGDDHAVVVAASEPTESQVFRVGFDDEIVPLTVGEGVHGAIASDGALAITHASLVRTGTRTRVGRGDGRTIELVSHAADPGIEPNVELLRLGDRELRAALVMPRDHRPGRRLPVLLDPYGGPHAQRVVHSRNAYLASQWFADQGFAVLIVDGRGTPSRGPAWEREVWGDLASAPLDDQVEALHAVAADNPDLDLDRVGIRGWSFGGYLAALGVLRRPDVFHAAVAGAPVTDWRLYDTHYTERYLGHPAEDAGSYERTDLTADAAGLTRPLLLIHGLADDNVVAAHTLQLSQALLEAGRPHEVLPLSGVSHMTPQEVVAENLLLLQVEFLKRSLSR
ncbi:MAG: prolyl oligopeptidase family serine peptidase [Acidimicrobiia bacterium]|nr:prolyl oligopeptidase family serine peptidase [Acidimicrobiia bacterium]